MNQQIDWVQFEKILMYTRQYFAMEYHAGTREMIYRYVVGKMGTDVSPMLVSAALKILKKETVILFDKKVWWYLGDR